MGKRNQARKAAQANKARRVAKRNAPAPAAKSAPASRGGGGGSQAQAAPQRSAGPQTANQMRKRVQRLEAAGKDTSNAQRRLDAVQAQRKQERNKSYGSQGEISGVSDFDFSKRGKDTVEKGELNYLKNQGFSKEEIAKHVNESGMKIRKGAQAKLDGWSAAKAKAKTVKENPVVKETPAQETIKVESTTTQTKSENSNANVGEELNTVPVYKPITVDPADTLLNTNGTKVSQSQDQAVSQDNDINSTITGDNNNVNISQDNSVRQYGGINKSFVYNGSSNGKNYMDTPVSAATMGGFYHDEDTPGKSASFVDRYTTMNSDYQKRFANTNFAQQAITKASQNKAVDVGALDQRVNDRAKANRARSSSMAGDIFGDMYNYKPAEFNPAKFDDDEEE
jgi:hypothetical protein